MLTRAIIITYAPTATSAPRTHSVALAVAAGGCAELSGDRSRAQAGPGIDRQTADN